MAYVVIARKWRPLQFEDVAGQVHVTRTLENAIRAGRVAHAFLFSGPRGVGKTSAARILARALCCESEEHPVPAPCGRCSACVEITEGRSTDVLEIDAASHTGVDNVREIIENVRYLPSRARYRIYVIDEVHMLSTGAFNALLKTLEEPPPHVKFILATTDPHRVPVTILSRCQRYDFRRIPQSTIASRLSAILSEEGVEHEPSALTLIAREADGSMRDAQSLLEQVLASAAGEPLSGPVVRDALGSIDAALVQQAFEALVGRRPAEVLEVVQAVHERGLDYGRFGEALLEYVRDSLVAKYLRDPSKAIDRPKDELEAVTAMARGLDAVWLERVFEGVARTVEQVGRTGQPRFTLEVGLAVLAEAPERVPVESLVADLDRVVHLLERGDVAAGGSPARGGPSSPGRGGALPSATRGSRGSAAAPPAPSHSSSQSPQAPSPSLSPPAPRSQSPAQSAGPSPSPVALPPQSAVATPVSMRSASDAPEEASEDSSERSGAALPTEPTAFAEFVRRVRQERPALAATLSQVRPLSFEASGVVLGCETAFDASKLSDRDATELLARLLEEQFGGEVNISVLRTEGGPRKGAGSGAGSHAMPPTLSEVDESRRRARRSSQEQAAREHPEVVQVVKALEATVARVRLFDDR